MFIRQGESARQGRGQEKTWGHPGIALSGCVTLAKWPNFSQPPSSFVKGDDSLYPTGQL